MTSVLEASDACKAFKALLPCEVFEACLLTHVKHVKHVNHEQHMKHLMYDLVSNMC